MHIRTPRTSPWPPRTVDPPQAPDPVAREVRCRPPKRASRLSATLAPDGGAPRTQESDPSAAVTLGTRTARPCGWWWLVTTPLLEPTCPTSARRSSREGSRATSHRAVARSQTCEDYATTPRRRVRARIVLSRRGQLVSFTILSKEGKIDYVRAEHAPPERWVAPNPWATLGSHVVASPASHGALVGGGLSVGSFP